MLSPILHELAEEKSGALKVGKVNARSIPLLAEAKAIVGNQGRVTVI